MTAQETAERRQRARAALQRRDFAAARREVERLVADEPGNPDGHGLLGSIRNETGDAAGAAESFATALRLRPGHGPTAHLLAAALLRLGDIDRALAVLAPAAAAAPDDAPLQATHAVALVRAERLAEAAEAAERATRRDPSLVPAWMNLGTARRLQGDNAGALAATDEAVRRQPDLAEAHVNRALALLSLGRMDEGWTEHDWYWRQAHTPPRPLPQPWWDGSAVQGRIAVWGDQGIGDQLWASAYIPDMVRAGHRLVLECPERAAGLFARSFPDIEVVAATDPVDARLTAPDIVAQTPLSRLAAIAWRRHGRTSRPDARLTPDPNHVAAIRARYRNLAGDRRILGIAWRSRKPDGQIFEVPLVRWEPLLRDRGLFVVNLQYGDTRDERIRTQEWFGTAPYHDEAIDAVADIDGFAAQVVALDGVATVVNATVATALAVGTPAIVAVRRFQPDWRYPPGAETSPWLPGARLVRQQAGDRWDDVMTRMVVLATA
ncbi:tetratricopeptide repeat protein [Stella humosa]|uniref:Tetratricopeptide repeat protein n=1 Tax=Stella humosa TaxID=94 RepID=A0A3N1L480_9PROT|nr:tetratricopeptide repeat protein [Stella humosa]ROP84215.1 tetratricopeptide repeat protein [Stella humosa]BBK33727.1 protein FlbA [Stella humosa]